MGLLMGQTDLDSSFTSQFLGVKWTIVHRVIGEFSAGRQEVR